MTPVHPFDRVIPATLSQSEFARLLGVTKARVSQWVRGHEQVPLDRCIEIEELTRRLAAEQKKPSLVVTCEDLRSAPHWHVLRDNQLPPGTRGKTN
jgi:DNA-binding transcriptional regulator YdaS (Cro superfamily)